MEKAAAPNIASLTPDGLAGAKRKRNIADDTRKGKFVKTLRH